MKRSIRTLLICLSASGLAAVAMAQSAVPVKPEAKQPAAGEAKASPAKQAPAPAQGMIVVIDPVTKQIVPPQASDFQALTGIPSSSAVAGESQPLTFQGPGNSVGLVLDSSSMVYMVATKTPDGKLESDCVTGDKAAESKVKGAQTTTAKKVALDVK